MSRVRSVKNRVLIVEDDAALRESLKLLLESFGFRVSAAANAGEAMLELGICKPDVVVTDVFMPVGGGLELIGSMRDFDAPTPVIAISGRAAGAGFDALEAARRLGACDTLAKPFLGSEIVEAVDRAIADPQRPADVARAANGTRAQDALSA